MNRRQLLPAPRGFTYITEGGERIQIVSHYDVSVSELKAELHAAAEALAKWGWDQERERMQ
jgi:hypothetical protein